MKIDVIMPQMGESVAEGTITRWLKKVGEYVERDEALFEVSTDKVDTEIPAAAAGYLVEILADEGATVEVNSKVAVLSSEPLGAESGSETSSETAEPAAATDTTKGATTSPPDAPRTPARLPEAASALPSRAEMDVETARRVRSSPLVRRIAKEHNIDISRIQGTGLSGRVTRKDIMSFIESGGASKTAGVPTRSETAARAPSTHTSHAQPPSTQPPRPSPDASGGGRGAHPAVSLDIPPHFLATPTPHDRVEPMSAMRKKIAEHMAWSKKISAHVNSFLEVDMTHIVRLRAKHKEDFQRRTGEKLTYMPFIMQASISALQAYPDCNASIVGDEVIYHRDINLGLAVALDWGLIVPVVHNAESLSLLGLTRALNDLATRARSRKLKPDEVKGGTFSITNPGGFGSLTGTPIIPQPQVAILGVGAINKRPWVVETPAGDAIAIRHIMMLSLSYDHRLVDGAVGSKFLNHIRDYLESYDPSQL